MSSREATQGSTASEFCTICSHFSSLSGHSFASYHKAKDMTCCLLLANMLYFHFSSLSGHSFASCHKAKDMTCCLLLANMLYFHFSSLSGHSFASCHKAKDTTCCLLLANMLYFHPVATHMHTPELNMESVTYLASQET